MKGIYIHPLRLFRPTAGRRQCIYDFDELRTAFETARVKKVMAMLSTQMGKIHTIANENGDLTVGTPVRASQCFKTAHVAKLGYMFTYGTV